VITRQLPDEAATQGFGGRLASALAGGGLLFLRGELGAGKTTLVRGLLRAFGHAGAVRSPTYTLVEPYEVGSRQLFHLDLYRLGDPEELEFLGLREILDAEAICLVEWPERGAGLLPAPDLELFLEYAGEGRQLTATARTSRGETMLTALA